MLRMLKRGRGRWGMVRMLLFCGAVFLTATAATAQAPHSDETDPAREAWYLVRHRCFLCHEIDRPEAKFAPSLMGLFERGADAKLFNGKPINDQTVTELILDGGPSMPSFQYNLNARQIRLILRYLKGDIPNAARQDNRHMEGRAK